MGGVAACSLGALLFGPMGVSCPRHWCVPYSQRNNYYTVSNKPIRDGRVLLRSDYWNTYNHGNVPDASPDTGWNPLARLCRLTSCFAIIFDYLASPIFACKPQGTLQVRSDGILRLRLRLLVRLFSRCF